MAGAVVDRGAPDLDQIGVGEGRRRTQRAGTGAEHLVCGAAAWCHDASVPETVDIDALEWRVRGAEGEWYERHTISQDLPAIAADALLAGWDTQSLRLLAGENPKAYVFDLGELFARALDELGRRAPSPERARWQFIQYVCWMVLTGQITRLDGGNRLERIHYWESPEVMELGHVSGLVDEWEGDWGLERREVEEELRRVARQLLERPLPE
jgi:hypothetical protein